MIKSKIKEKLEEKINAKTLKVLSVLIGFSQALVIYIASSFFKDFSGRDDVGIFYVITYSIFLIILLNLHKVIAIIGKTKILLFSLASQLLVIVGLIYVADSWAKLALLISFILFDQLILVSLDILLKTVCPNASTGRTRGSYLVILNVGFILGPKLSTWLLAYYSYIGIFVVVLIFKLIALAIVYFRLGEINHCRVDKESVCKLVKKAFSNQDIRRIYYISYVLESFYALMIMYSPLYMLSIGMSWAMIGTIFTIMLLPFLFFEYPIGWLADKELGEKEMIIFFLSWMTIFTAWVYTLDKPIAWLWALALFATRLGAAAIEILRDSYFYKKIKEDDVDLIDFYRTARPVAYIVVSAASVYIVHIFGLREVFLFAACILFTALYPAWRLRDNLSESEKFAIRQSKAILLEPKKHRN